MRPSPVVSLTSAGTTAGPRSRRTAGRPGTSSRSPGRTRTLQPHKTHRRHRRQYDRDLRHTDTLAQHCEPRALSTATGHGNLADSDLIYIIDQPAYAGCGFLLAAAGLYSSIVTPGYPDRRQSFRLHAGVAARPIADRWRPISTASPGLAACRRSPSAHHRHNQRHRLALPAHTASRRPDASERLPLPDRRARLVDCLRHGLDRHRRQHAGDPDLLRGRFQSDGRPLAAGSRPQDDHGFVAGRKHPHQRLEHRLPTTAPQLITKIDNRRFCASRPPRRPATPAPPRRHAPSGAGAAISSITHPTTGAAAALRETSARTSPPRRRTVFLVGASVQITGTGRGLHHARPPAPATTAAPAPGGCPGLDGSIRCPPPPFAPSAISNGNIDTCLRQATTRARRCPNMFVGAGVSSIQPSRLNASGMVGAALYLPTIALAPARAGLRRRGRDPRRAAGRRADTRSPHRRARRLGAQPPI